ncbi:MAG: FAD-dependent oxidoreductase [Pseudohongiellaceae bacterium]
MTSSYSTDIVIFGGGIAGLWLLNRLRDEGYRAVLLEADKLGSGQTLASQGIIHGGLKYALNGALNGASNVIAGMPAHWRSCLAGEGDIDLRGCRVLSDHYYMWSDSGFRSKLKTFLGSKSLVGRVCAVDKKDYPAFFKGATTQGILYRLPDFVLDTGSLLQVLVEKQQNHIFNVKPGSYRFHRNSAGNVCALTLDSESGEIHLQAQRFIFSAGKGNQGLIENAGLDKPKSQLRPLNMVYVKGETLPAVFVHCIGDSFSLTPRLTVTSHTDADGKTVWYLGGEIAESGVGKDRTTQIRAAQTLLAELFPWVDLDGAEFNCFTIDRAEANVNNNYRPEDAYFIEDRNVLVAWPTKLTLTPNLADKIIEHFACSNLDRASLSAERDLGEVLNSAEIAVSRWE